MSLARPKEQWLEIFVEQTDGTPLAIADRIISDIWGYNTFSRTEQYRAQDNETLANALEAFKEYTHAYAS